MIVQILMKKNNNKTLNTFRIEQVVPFSKTASKDSYKIIFSMIRR